MGFWYAVQDCYRTTIPSKGGVLPLKSPFVIPYIFCFFSVHFLAGNQTPSRWSRQLALICAVFRFQMKHYLPTGPAGSRTYPALTAPSSEPSQNGSSASPARPWYPDGLVLMFVCCSVEREGEMRTSQPLSVKSSLSWGFMLVWLLKSCAICWLQDVARCWFKVRFTGMAQLVYVVEFFRAARLPGRRGAAACPPGFAGACLHSVGLTRMEEGEIDHLYRRVVLKGNIMKMKTHWLIVGGCAHCGSLRMM